MYRIVVGIIVVAVLAIFITYSATGASTHRCGTGTAKAFLVINKEPFLAGRIPNQYTSSPQYFGRKYNCQGGSIEVKRVDLGTYDVRLEGITARVVHVTAMSAEGVSASALYLGGSVYRVVMRGPGPQLRDVAFSLAVF
jgi:hypothetical protein